LQYCYEFNPLSSRQRTTMINMKAKTQNILARPTRLNQLPLE